MSKGKEFCFGEIKNGNHLAFKHLFDQTYEDLVAYAHTYLYEKDASEDVVQEVFVCLWERSDSISIDVNLRSYLFAMVRNKCLNHLKKIKITDCSKVLEQEIETQIDWEIGLFEENQEQLLYNRVKRVIDGLPKKMKYIVELRYQNQYRYQEIAEELNISVNTVKTQLRRAKAKFAELMLALLLFIWH